MLFYVWEDARGWAHWIHSSDVHLSYLGLVSCFLHPESLRVHGWGWQLKGSSILCFLIRRVVCFICITSASLTPPHLSVPLWPHFPPSASLPPVSPTTLVFMLFRRSRLVPILEFSLVLIYLAWRLPDFRMLAPQALQTQFKYYLLGDTS